MTKAGKFLTKAGKFFGKFDVFRLKHFTLESERDMNACLQVKTASLHNLSAFGRELQNRNHVKLFDSLPSIRR